MPKKPIYDHDLHGDVYLAMTLLYLLDCIGLDKIAIGMGLAICHYLLYRF